MFLSRSISSDWTTSVASARSGASNGKLFTSRAAVSEPFGGAPLENATPGTRFAIVPRSSAGEVDLAREDLVRAAA